MFEFSSKVKELQVELDIFESVPTKKSFRQLQLLICAPGETIEKPRESVCTSRQNSEQISFFAKMLPEIKLEFPPPSRTSTTSSKTSSAEIPGKLNQKKGSKDKTKQQQ